jgi:hypothetical protein
MEMTRQRREQTIPENMRHSYALAPEYRHLEMPESCQPLHVLAQLLLQHLVYSLHRMPTVFYDAASGQ